MRRRKLKIKVICDKQLKQKDIDYLILDNTVDLLALISTVSQLKLL